VIGNSSLTEACLGNSTTSPPTAEQDDCAAKMPEKVRELEAIWQRQPDEFTALA
jgi:hypothetical protein